MIHKIHKEMCEVKWTLGSITMNKASAGDKIPAELLKIPKYGAVKVLYLYVSKVWKLSSSHETEKDWFSFQSQRRAMSKDVQTTVQVHSFHMLVRLCSKSFRGFPGCGSSKEPTCHSRKHKRLRFNPWVGKIPWRRKWQPTPVFLTGESHGQRSLVGCSLQGCKELDTSEAT